MQNRFENDAALADAYERQMKAYDDTLDPTISEADLSAFIGMLDEEELDLLEELENL